MGGGAVLLRRAHLRHAECVFRMRAYCRLSAYLPAGKGGVFRLDNNQADNRQTGRQPGKQAACRQAANRDQLIIDVSSLTKERTAISLQPGRQAASRSSKRKSKLEWAPKKHGRKKRGINNGSAFTFYERANEEGSATELEHDCLKCCESEAFQSSSHIATTLECPPTAVRWLTISIITRLRCYASDRPFPSFSRIR